MKKIFKKAFSAFALFSCVAAFGFSQGVEYEVLSKPLDVPKNSLVKVFSYACPFCYKYDKAVTPAVVKGVDGLVLLPYHLKTKGEFALPASQVFAVLLAMDRADGVDILSDESKFKKAKFAYYKAYHDKKERWAGGESKFLATGLSAAGVSESEFKSWLEKPEVKKMLSDWDSGYDVAKIQGVPAFVVNGKFLIYTAKISSIEQFKALVLELLQK